MQRCVHAAGKFCNLELKMEKACSKCFHYVPGRYSHTGHCTRYLAYRGRGRIVYDFASNVRFDQKRCGAAAKLFVAKDPKDRERHETLLHLLNDDE